MKTVNRAKVAPEIGHSTERLYEDRKMKEKSKTQAGNAICECCGAIGMHKGWFFDGKLAAHLKLDPLTRYVKCPGCKRVDDEHYEGEVFLEGELLLKNKDMVLSTIYNEAARSYLHNPLSRLALIEDDGDKIHIVTTTCTLAERIGKAIQRCMKGVVQIKPSPGEKFVIVKWTHQ